MSDITFSLSLPRWLGQWFVHRCGGTLPVRLPKGSMESTIVQRFSRHKSTGTPDFPKPGSIAVAIPENKAKPAAQYCVIPESAKIMLYKSILAHFDLCLFDDIVKPIFPAMLKKDLIFLWMEQNGIEGDETNWFAVEKRFSRMRARLLCKDRVEKSRKKTRNAV